MSQVSVRFSLCNIHNLNQLEIGLFKNKTKPSALKIELFLYQKEEYTSLRGIYIKDKLHISPLWNIFKT